VLTIRNHLLLKLLHQLMLSKHHENVHQVQQELQVLHDFVRIIYLEQVQQFHLFDHYLIVNMLQVPRKRINSIDLIL
jgi:hypothetical protein